MAINGSHIVLVCSHAFQCALLSSRCNAPLMRCVAFFGLLLHWGVSNRHKELVIPLGVHIGLYTRQHCSLVDESFCRNLMSGVFQSRRGDE